MADEWDQFPDAPVAQQAAPQSQDPWDAFPDAPVVTPGGGINGSTRITPAAPAPRTFGRDLAIGAQGVGAGLRDMALMPFDLAAGAQNIVAGGINKVFGTEIPQATPASQMAEKVLDPISISESSMTPSEKLSYNINRFGTQGVAGGAALSTRAPAVLEASKPAADFAGRTLDTLARPYTASPVRTTVGDAIGGAGAGAGVTAANEFLPKEPASPLGEVFKSIATVLAPLLGGVAATTTQGATEGVGGLLRNMTKKRTDVNVPKSDSGASFSHADSDRAARTMQDSATTTPRAAALDIRENAAELTNPTRPGETPVEPSQLPTTGLLSRDPGLVTAEQGARVKSSPPFIQRDQNVKEAGAQRVDSLRDPEADQSAVTTAAQNDRESRVSPVEQRVQQFQDIERRTNDARQQQGAEFGAVANTNAQAQASGRLDQTLVDQNYVPARTEKNRQFDAAPGRYDELPADDVFASIDRIRQRANDLAPGTLPADFMHRLDNLRPVIDPESGQNVGGPGTAQGGDLADLRKFIGAAEQNAQRSGNFDLADNLRDLRGSINRTINDAPGYAEANANYGQFADRYRPDRNDEMAKFTKELDRSGNTDGAPNRGSTPPSETAKRFLSSPEKSQTLQRVLDGAQNAQQGQAAVRDYMRSDFAQSALNADGTINPARASAWARNNADVLEQFPAVRDEITGVVQQAQRGQNLSNDARAFVDQARRDLKATEAEIDRSATGTLLREDPRDVASKILNGGYDATKRVDEIATIVRNDPEAARGWKAAVSEVLTDRVTSTRKVGETPEVQYARLAKEFKDNEQILAKVYSPEEMNTLRQAHKLLGYFKEAEKRSTVGSQTAERMAIPQWLQLGARHLYGDLKGGGIVKRFKLMLELLPTNKQSADEIVQKAWFNPDLAAYLLEKPIKNVKADQYNVHLRRLLSIDNAARESGDNEPAKGDK